MHVVIYIRISFPFKAEQYSNSMHILLLFIGSFFDVHLFATVNNAAMNMSVQISL